MIRQTSAYSGNYSQTSRQPAPRQLLNGPWGDLSSFTLWEPQLPPPTPPPPPNGFSEAWTFLPSWAGAGSKFDDVLNLENLIFETTAMKYLLNKATTLIKTGGRGPRFSEVVFGLPIERPQYRGGGSWCGHAPDAPREGDGETQGLELAC